MDRSPQAPAVASTPARWKRALPLALLVLATATGMALLRQYESRRVAHELSANARPGDIMMISSETCVYCEQARAWFTENNVAFGECFIERDPSCAAAYSALHAPGTPTLVVRGKRLVGFNAEQVAQALRRG